MSTIAYKSAQRQVRFFARQAKEMKEHRLAMNCRDCEDFLQVGIDAFHWMKRAEEELRRTLYEGTRENDPTISATFDRLYHTWMMPVAIAEQWIALQQANGYEPDNLAEFRRASQEVREIVENRDWAKVAEQALCTSDNDSDNEEW